MKKSLDRPSVVASPALIAAALCRAGRELNLSGTWQPASDENGKHQQRLLAMLPVTGDAFDLPEPNILASHDPARLNTFQKQHDLAQCFDESDDTAGISIATVLSLTLQWWEAPRPVVIVDPYAAQSYRGLELSSGIRVMNGGNYNNPIVKIPAQHGLQLWLAVIDPPADELAVMEEAVKLTTAADLIISHTYTGVRLPVPKISTPTTLSWLRGLHRDENRIKQVVQSHRLDITGKLTRAAEPATAFNAHLATEHAYCWEIKQPFLGVITHSSYPIPFCAFYAHTSEWQGHDNVNR